MIKTLIIDDSPLVREIIKDFLEAEGSFKVIGHAADGREGVEKILSLNPDLVTMDIAMPEMNGLQAIEEALRKTSVPIVVVTDYDTAETAYQATLKGALEFYGKDIFTPRQSPAKQREVYETLKRISGVKARKPASGGPVSETPLAPRPIAAVVIAASTGGPKALASFFSVFPKAFPVPVIVVQHNTSGFDAGFAAWLGGCTPLTVKLADDGEPAYGGTVYIARTDKHLTLRKTETALYLAYADGEPEHNQKPAADVLFRSAAETLKTAVVSVVLTGMGDDGAAGTRKIREMGGVTLAQDEATSLIYGMPKAAAETGCLDMALPLDRLPEKLIALAGAAYASRRRS